MSVRRVLLLGLAAILAAATVLVATRDVRVGSSNCGSAVLPADGDRPTFRTGDPYDDDFTRAAGQVDCERAVTGRRLLAALPAVGAAAAAWVARRERRAAERLRF